MVSSVVFVGLAAMQVLTGSLNTIFVKLADLQESENSAGETEVFNHPFLQAASMFVGEMCCLLVYLAYNRFKKEPSEEVAEGIIKFQNPRHGYLFLIPAMCDMVATSMMYVGLTYTTASSFQIFRGSLIIFTGLLTVIWLRKRLEWFKWVGMFVILGGLAMVGVGDLTSPKDCLSANLTDNHPTPEHPLYQPLHVATGAFGAKLNTDDDLCADDNSAASGEFKGDMLIVGAQVVMAFQGVYEEKILVKYEVNPLLAVGWEGVFGFSVLSILLVPFGYWKVGPNWSHGPNGYFEDALDGFAQLGNSTSLLIWFICTIFSIGFFNFAGMLVTKRMGATTRTVLDAVRTVVVWVFFLSFGWETFRFWSLGGFLVVVTGVFLFNNILFVPLMKKLINKEN